MQKSYIVICDECKGDREIRLAETLAGDRVDWLEGNTKGVISIISGRKRLDGFWGWQCSCGNNSLLTRQEASNITNKQNPDMQEIADITKNLELPKVVIKGNDTMIDKFILRAI